MKPYLLQDKELKELIAKIPGWKLNQNILKENLIFKIL